MTIWRTSIDFYGETLGLAMEGYYDSHYLHLHPTNQESLSIPFLFWQPPGYSITPWWKSFFWSQYISLSSPENFISENTSYIAQLSDLSFINISLDEDPDEFSYLIFDNFGNYENLFIDLDSTDIELSVDNRNDIELEELFTELLKDPSWFNRVESAEFDIVKFLEVPPIIQDPGKESPIGVPEGSSVVGVFAIGLTLVGMAIKRSFFQKA